MKISSEAKVGLIGIATLLVLIWGINYLKGRNILSQTYTLHAFYKHSGGLENSAPVLMNGIKIGYIDDIELQPGRTDPVHVILHVEKKYPLDAGASAVLFSSDLLGTKAIRMEPSGESGQLHHQDTINTDTETDMLAFYLFRPGCSCGGTDRKPGTVTGKCGSEAGYPAGIRCPGRDAG